MNYGGGYQQPQAAASKLALAIPEQNKNLFYGLIACIAVIVIGCFLPYVTYAGESMNYVYDEGIKDGIFVIILGVGALFLAFKGKYIGTLACQGVGAALTIYDWVDTSDKMKKINELSSLIGTEKMKFGIGFWLVLIGVVGSLVVAFLLWQKTKSTKPAQQPAYPQSTMPQQPMMNQPMMGQPTVSSTCPYCNAPKNPNLTNCPNCGAKY